MSLKGWSSVGVIDEIADWLRTYAAAAGSRGYVVGLSGGVDSACTAALCQRAMGEHVLAALLPCHSEAPDAELAHQVADAFGLQTVTVELGPAYDHLLMALPSKASGLAAANIKPRLRMTALYALAQMQGYLVAGTGNKSEIMIGYFTKYGDGGVDVEPVGDLYKWQVRRLARDLGVPQAVIDRTPSAGLWAGQTDEGEMGLTYAELDAALVAIETGQTAGVAPQVLTKVREMIAGSAHKRAIPPICPVTWTPEVEH
jgi:NAD+ synthase